MKNPKTERLVVSAILIATATVLSILQIPMPFGGGLTIVSMLPIILISYRYGLIWGFMSSTVYAFIQMALGYATIAKYVLPGEDQMDIGLVILMCALDYLLAYIALGIGGAFRKMKPTTALALGALTSTFVRYICHFISGFILWSAWAGWFFSDEVGGQFGSWVLENMSGAGLSAFYSFVYNGIYMIPEIVLTTVVAIIISKIPPIAKTYPSKLV